MPRKIKISKNGNDKENQHQDHAAGGNDDPEGGNEGASQEGGCVRQDGDDSASLEPGTEHSNSGNIDRIPVAGCLRPIFCLEVLALEDRGTGKI